MCVDEKQHEYYLKHRDKIKANQKKYYRAHREERKKYFHGWLEENRLHFNELMRNVAKRHREKYNVRKLTARHIKIPIGQKCEICHKAKATQRHHPDYSKPLKVVFVCIRCHNLIEDDLK